MHAVRTRGSSGGLVGAAVHRSPTVTELKFEPEEQCTEL